MKILIYENSGEAGFFYYCNNLTKALCINNKINLLYLTTKNNRLKYRDNKINYIEELYSYDKKISKKNFYWMFDRIFISLRNCLVREKIIIKENIDILHLNQLIPIIDQFFIKGIKKNCKLIITVHDVIPPVKSFYWNLKSLKKVYNSADCLVVHTKKNYDELVNKFNIKKEKIVVIPHGVEMDSSTIGITDGKDYLNIQDDKKYVLFFGAIRESKGLDILIQAMEGLENVGLIIAGNTMQGEDFKSYEKMILENNINAICHIRYIEEEEIPLFFKASDLLALPYKEFYSQSGVLMQAITYKLPVVATTEGGMSEIIDSYGVGEVCVSNNVQALRHSIVKVINNNDELSKYKKNMETAYTEMGWKAVGKQYEDVYFRIDNVGGNA